MKELAKTLAATALLVAAARGQVSAQAVLVAPLQLQAQVTGGPLNTLTLPIGTNVTNSGTLVVSSTVSGHGGATAVSVASSTGPLGTTCVLSTGASFSTFALGTVPFSAQQSGAELLTFSSPTPIGGALIAEGLFIPSGGPAQGFGTITCDFGNDGSVELTQSPGNPVRHSQTCTVGPGQDVVVRVTHQGSLSGIVIGDYTLQLTVRFVPHADGLAEYGPSSGCRPVLLSHFLTGNSMVAVGGPAPDAWVLAVGNSQVSTVLPIPSACPQLSSAELILGPLPSNVVQLPFAAVQLGAHAYLQFVGLHFATLTADASLGIDAFGQ